MRGWKIFIILVILAIFSLSGSYMVKNVDLEDQIVIIPLKGIILSSNGGLLNQEVVIADDVVNHINKANSNKNVKGIVLEISSPGGTALASKEIAQAVKYSKKPVVAWIRDVGASGAYWVASASDIIVADELSITGSVGVIGSYLEFSGLMEEYGVEYQRLVGGKYKDVGSIYRDLNGNERQLLQGKIDLIHKYFIDEVKNNRNLEVGEWSEGLFYLGSEAKGIGLVDELGSKDLVIRLVEQKAGVKDARIITLKKEIGFFDNLSRFFSSLGYGIGIGLKDGNSQNLVWLK